MTALARARSSRSRPRAWRCARAGPLLLLLAVALAPAMARAELARVRLGAASGSDLVAVEGDDRRIHVEALPRPGEGLNGLVVRLCGAGGARARAEVSAANGGVERLERGVRYRIPFSCLRPELQIQTLQALFPDDVLAADGWRHRVVSRRGAPPPDLWSVAELFTGSGEEFRQLRGANRLRDERLEPGQEVLVPRSLLRPSLEAALPRSDPAVSALIYERDQRGEYAVYRLDRGEALYSSVVARFTGRIFAEDVNQLATEIAARSGIADVTDIPIGYPVRIPLELLAPEHLPIGHPRRQEYERDLAESSGYANLVRSRNLEGVTVILDAGHGGRDVGASIDGVWESVYAYDIVLRIRRLLGQTAAETVMTTRDGGEWKVAERDVLASSRGHAVLTTPPYAIDDSRVSSNLRWYLANSVYGRAVSNGGEADKVVFLSVHADSLHPSVRGAMVYVPGLLGNPSHYGKTGAVYASRREVQERPRVDFAHADRARSEGLSRDLAKHMIASMRRHGIAIHPNKPIRDRVIRGKHAWVPAVLRFNAVPAKILIEACNLANGSDRRLIQTRAFREEVARAVVEGLLAYYGVEPGDRQDGQVAGR
ncbi:MAG TPA: N-acetylmuramoyl-L-alanine amidase [Thermoanaerobaculia bacterium]|nr:N-acetylmuramoyl-L-alanine amidase [Thermoanaerobaculia bacterium]